MPKHTRMMLMGFSTTPVGGKIDSDSWMWWIECPQKEIPLEEIAQSRLNGKEGVAFIRELLPLLPEMLQQPVLLHDGRYIFRSMGKQGETWQLFFAISECPEPSRAEAVIAKYFPSLYPLI